jgi:hypothetical protein
MLVKVTALLEKIVAIAEPQRSRQKMIIGRNIQLGVCSNEHTPEY